MSHRGRFQAQGKKLEESEPWEQGTPLILKDGQTLLKTLESKLKPKDRRIRKESFIDCMKTIVRIQKNGGYNVTHAGKPLLKSFPVDDTEHERVDLEIHAGIALI
ncbi:hypothetical protein ACFST9_16830 [Hymenobacter monticola]|uniref:Uncharacterized protein n=1 Tax=Hymenobacter monticola TaxID=1705399 RepID=A0ABY4AZW0_9BACT|nr:hypothetical protein [Hymenobacter monticola]UOE32427.1 hypothetical protein MTP16_14950 [Hymenobacter monticola]